MKPEGNVARAKSVPLSVLVLSLLFSSLFLALPIPRATLSAGGSSQAGASSPQVLVGLFRADSVSFTCQGAWFLHRPEKEPVPLPAGGKLTLKVSKDCIAWQIAGDEDSGESVEVGNLFISTGPMANGPFLAVESQEAATARYQGKSFRGGMLALIDDGALLIANALDMEEYVQSVVGGEMPDSWPEEANRAQAVAARTYAAHRTGLNLDGVARDYEAIFTSLRAADVLMWGSDQVYRGICEETAVTVSAALSTRGQVLTYGGVPIAAYYHSDAGGMTEDPCYVWGRSVPYLSPVVEGSYETPHESWTVTLSPSDILTAMDRLDLGLQGQPEYLYGIDRGASGRWYSVSIRSESDQVIARGNDLRIALPQVKSALFSSYMVGGGKVTTGSLCAGMCYSVATSSGVKEAVVLTSTFVCGQTGEAVRPPAAAVVISEIRDECDPEIILKGSGWGHGVGLSQWGARGMALEGEDARAILMLYYPDATLEQWW